MTTKGILLWIHQNLANTIDQALADSKKKNPFLIYTTDWLVGMAYRETWTLISKYASANTAPAIMHALMKGDYSQRPSEKEPRYHGYGYWQIDVASFPDFVSSGDWKDPYKTCMKAIAVMEDKSHYITAHLPKLGGDDLQRAITAAYNCGEGNVVKVLSAGQNVDARTTGRDYSVDVWRKRAFYKQILSERAVPDPNTISGEATHLST